MQGLMKNLKSILDSNDIFTFKALKKELNYFLNELGFSIKIQSSSTDILKFLVCDILDFAQIKGGKFRKDCNNFNIREAIEEIMLIQ